MKKSMILLCLAALLAAASSLAGKKPGSNSLDVEVAWEFDEPVSVFCVPDGSGNPLSTAFTYGGGIVDATLTVTLLSAGHAVWSVPAEDILLVSGGARFHFCGEEGAVCGSGITGEDGVMILTGSIPGGGFADPDGLGSRIVVDTYFSGEDLSSFSGAIPLFMNSPDINGDGFVNLLDVTIMSRDQDKLAKLGMYSYRSDFNWDGRIDEIDEAMFSSAWGHDCP